MEEPHKCKYCGVETTQPDEECYAKPKQETLETAAKKYSGLVYDRNDYEEKYYNQQGVIKSVCDVCDSITDKPTYKLCDKHYAEYEKFKQTVL